MSLPEPQKAALRYLRRVLTSFDQFGNVLTGGELNETISARAARLRNKGAFYGCVMCKFLDVFQARHCDIVLEDHLTQARVTVQDATASVAASPP